MFYLKQAVKLLTNFVKKKLVINHYVFKKMASKTNPVVKFINFHKNFKNIHLKIGIFTF